MTQPGEKVCDHHESLYGRCTACGMTWAEQSQPAESDFRLHKGTRRVHRGSGVVWRVQTPPTVSPLDGGPRRMVIVRESDGAVRSVGEDYWLGDGWDRPRTRAGASPR